jgi:hypothetical protein
MKWNWGTKLVVAMAAFMTMVIIFVVLMMRESINLVEKDYYPKGQAFQEQIDKSRNADPWISQMKISADNQTLTIQFPDAFDPLQISGTAHLYHRSEDGKDGFFELKNPVDSLFSFPLGNSYGRFILKLDWKYQQQAFYSEHSIDL